MNDTSNIRMGRKCVYCGNPAPDGICRNCIKKMNKAIKNDYYFWGETQSGLFLNSDNFIDEYIPLYQNENTIIACPSFLRKLSEKEVRESLSSLEGMSNERVEQLLIEWRVRWKEYAEQEKLYKQITEESK